MAATEPARGVGPGRVEVPRARLATADGSTREWRSEALPRYARRTRQVEALVAGAYLAGTNTRPVGGHRKQLRDLSPSSRRSMA